MPRREDPSKRIKAAEVYRQTGSVSKAARESGVSRNTLYRWMKDPDFMLSDPGVEDPLTLKELQDKALRVLNDALDGQKITTAQMRAAVEVTKTSGQLKEHIKTEGSNRLQDLIREIDDEGGEVEPD